MTAALLGRIALVPLGVLLALLLAEAALQIGARVLDRRPGERAEGFATDRVRVVTLGDSNTYGLYVEREEAYPQRLEAHWNATGTEPRIEVVNLGVPGVNSSVLLRELPGVLEAFRPDILLVMVGANDFWTEPVTTAETERDGGLVAWLLRTSRLYRLYLTRARWDAVAWELDEDMQSTEGASHRARYGGHEFELGFRRAAKVDPGRARRALRSNLITLADTARDAGVHLVLMTYPAHAGAYAAANRHLRDAGRRADVTLVDVASAFEPLCPDPACAEWLYPDQHPRARGYDLMAKTLTHRLRRLLESRGQQGAAR